jgi:hypothetical protein
VLAKKKSQNSFETKENRTHKPTYSESELTRMHIEVKDTHK